MESIFLILIFALIVALIIIVLMKNRDRGSDLKIEDINKSQEDFIARINVAHEKEMTLLRENFNAQKSDMKADFADRIARIEESSERRIAEMKKEFDRQNKEMEARHKEQIEAMQAKTAMEFQNISQQILDSRTKALSETNNSQLDAILTPLKERIESFNTLVRTAYADENASRKGLKEQIDILINLNKDLGQEAHNLTTALKGNSKTQGDWGEMMLQTLLQQAGLEEGIHYETQVTRDENGNLLKSEDGSASLRPDVVINLPDNKKMIVDSKVSLNAFVEYTSCEDDEQRKEFGKKHLESVRKHIKELGEKNYPASLKNSCKHVLMYVPIENAYTLAMRLDNTLWKDAYNMNVAIVSPTHLFSVVQIISQLWTQDAQNKNVMKIADEGGKLYDKLTSFCTQFKKIEENLTRAKASYDDAYKTLAEGRGNVISKAENMKRLGAKAAKILPITSDED
jgi:DNA recombination protein RmuC